jgi:hypothetical protein
MMRKTLTMLYQESDIRTSDQGLMVNGQLVSVVYYRAGYSPNDYPSDQVML